MSDFLCPSCRSSRMVSFYQCDDVPVHTTLLMPTAQRALDYPRGKIDLAYCESCGFVTNRAFEKGIHQYSVDCEESQGCSPTFSAWLEGVAKRLIDGYNIRHKTVLEIGCGKGEFLATICQQGNNTGIGYDPAFVPGRLDQALESSLKIHSSMWSGEQGLHDADVIVCRHTLEHIPEVRTFLQDIRREIGDNPDTLLFFEVPDILRVLKEGAFWDIYYEHCSYFSAESLQLLFQISGFEVLELWLDYDEQYVMLVAKPSVNMLEGDFSHAAGQTLSAVSAFTAAGAVAMQHWSSYLAQCSEGNKTPVLWGGGSKAAAFLNRLDTQGVIKRVIDINPNKHHAYIPGSGQEVVSPNILDDGSVDAIIVMNAIYLEEIQQYLHANHHAIELLSL